MSPDSAVPAVGRHRLLDRRAAAAGSPPAMWSRAAAGRPSWSAAARGVAADVRLAPRADIAMLITDGGPAAIPGGRRACRLREGQRGFHPGFPQGRPGEVDLAPAGPRDPAWCAAAARATSRCWPGPRPAAPTAWAARWRACPARRCWTARAAWSASPSPRARAAAASTPPRPTPVGPAIRGVQTADEPADGEPINIDNYGQVADDLRRDLRVAQVVCLSV